MTINQSLLGQESKAVARLCIEDPDLEVLFKHFLANFCALVDHIDKRQYPEELFDQLINVALLLHANMPKMLPTKLAGNILALDYYERERYGAPLTDEMYFRCQKRLAVFIRTCAIVEGTSPSGVIRRLLHVAAQGEGYDPDGA